MEQLLWRTVVTSRAHISYNFNPDLGGQSKQPVERKKFLQSPFLYQEGLGSSPLVPCWYLSPKQRLIGMFLSGLFYGKFGQQPSNTNQLFILRYVMQEFSTTRDYQHVGRSLQPHIQIQWQPLLCKFIASSASVVFYFGQFAAIPGQSLCD